MQIEVYSVRCTVYGIDTLDTLDAIEALENLDAIEDLGKDRIGYEIRYV